jgi:hypothetical protein
MYSSVDSTWPLERVIRDDLCFTGFGPRVRAAPQNPHVKLPTWETTPKLISEHLSLDWASRMDIKGMDDVKQNDRATQHCISQSTR